MGYGVEHGANHSHDDCGGSTVAGNIRNQQVDRMLIPLEKIVVITADFGRGLHENGDIITRDLRQSSGEHGKLKIPGILKFLGLSPVLRLECPLLCLDGLCMEFRLPHARLLFALVHFESSGPVEKTHHEQTIRAVCPPRLPPGGRNGHP